MESTEAYVKYIFNMAGVGMPYRVDFTPCGKTTGFKEDTRPSAYKSAFVHFHLFYDGADSVISFEGLNEGVFQTIEYEPYWRILKNRNPVASTMMNHHQIVANCCILEEKVAKCCALEERVAQLEKDREYHSGTFELMSKRISILEKNLYTLSDFVLNTVTPQNMYSVYSEPKIEYENLDSDSVSTHSSMPSLEYYEQIGLTEEDIADIASSVIVDERDGPTEEEVSTSVVVGEDVGEDEDENQDVKRIAAMIQLVQNRLNVVRANATERIKFSASFCGNE